jgi:hypothetical protein
MKYEVYGSRHKTIEVEADSPQAAAAVLRAEGFEPHTVEQVDAPGPFTVEFQCVGRCEACGSEVMLNDGHAVTLDDVRICKGCLPKRK